MSRANNQYFCNRAQRALLQFLNWIRGIRELPNKHFCEVSTIRDFAKIGKWVPTCPACQECCALRGVWLAFTLAYPRQFLECIDCRGVGLHSISLKWLKNEIKKGLRSD